VLVRLGLGFLFFVLPSFSVWVLFWVAWAGFFLFFFPGVVVFCGGGWFEWFVWGFELASHEEISDFLYLDFFQPVPTLHLSPVDICFSFFLAF